jgi:branched-chain amino acid transport system ATP-binding protein
VSPTPLLRVRSLTTRFDALVAVDDVSLSIHGGSITGLIGPNGAGKSTLFNSIVGELRPDCGEIDLNGEAIHGLTPDKLFRKGLARTFQIPQPFAQMTVMDNLLLAATEQIGERYWAPYFRSRKIRRQERLLHDRAQEILEFTTLAGVAGQAAGSLSGGQQKLLELARVLMSDPKLILLDEPAAGVNPALVEVLIEKIRDLNRLGITFLIIEHNMDFVMQHCEPIIAMANGRVIFEGTSDAAQQSDALLDSYLGGIDDGLDLVDATHRP